MRKFKILDKRYVFLVSFLKNTILFLRITFPTKSVCRWATRNWATIYFHSVKPCHSNIPQQIIPKQTKTTDTIYYVEGRIEISQKKVYKKT